MSAKPLPPDHPDVQRLHAERKAQGFDGISDDIKRKIARILYEAAERHEKGEGCPCGEHDAR